MRCGRADRLIERYIDGKLPAGLAGELTEHLDRCERCATRLEEARAVETAFRGSPAVRAPEALFARIMDAVYREEAVRRRQVAPSRGAAPIYRRLGYSFVATAALLAASLFIPRIAYPELLHSQLLAEGLRTGNPAAVARLVQDAGQGFGAVIGGEHDSRDR